MDISSTDAAILEAIKYHLLDRAGAVKTDAYVDDSCLVVRSRHGNHYISSRVEDEPIVLIHSYYIGVPDFWQSRIRVDDPEFFDLIVNHTILEITGGAERQLY